MTIHGKTKPYLNSSYFYPGNIIMMNNIKYFLKNLLFPPLENFSLQTDSESILHHIRERVVTILLRLCAVLGLVSVTVGSIASWQEEAWGAIILGNVALLGIIILAVNRRINYKTRSAILVLIAYTYLFSSFLEGINELSFVTLYSFVVMTTLLLGRRGGSIASLISLPTLLIAHWLVATSTIPQTTILNSFRAPLSTILYPYTDWFFYVGIFLFTAWFYFDGFNVAWQREKQARQLLAAERDRLEEAVVREQELLQQLSEAHQAEIELSRLKSQIITTVSHEFRTPLTVINNSVDLLTKYDGKFKPEKRAEIHHRINESIFYLSELLEDASMVNKAHVQGFTAKLEPIPFNVLAYQLQSQLLHETHQPTNVVIKFPADEAAEICVDYHLLYRAVYNLLSNALKYSPPARPVLVELKLDKQLIISVTDEGIGIAQADLQKIWTVFYRGENTAERQGLGLGLYLTRQLVNTMEGTVTAVSAGPDQGSTFTIKIPLKLPLGKLAAN